MEHTFTVRAEMMWASRNNPKLIEEVRNEFAILEALGIHIRYAHYTSEYFVVTVGTQDRNYHTVLNERMKSIRGICSFIVYYNGEFRMRE